MGFWDFITSIYLVILSLAAMLLSFPRFLEKTHLDSKIKKHKKKFTIVCIILSIIFLGCSVYKYFQDRHTSNKIGILSNNMTEYKRSTDSLVHYIDSVNKDPTTLAKSGFSVAAVLTFAEVDEKRDQYILDCGDYENRNRVSLFIDSSHNLVYRIIDNEGKVFTIKTPRNHFTFKKEANYFLYFDYGFSDYYSFMRLYLDRNMVGEVKMFNRGINLNIQKGTFLIFTDITKKYFGKCTLQLLSFLKEPLTYVKIRALANIYIKFMENLGIDI